MAFHPATIPMVAGVLLVVWAFRRHLPDMRRSLADPKQSLGMARCLRTSVLGLAAVTAGAGWLWEVWPLVGLAAVIAAEETLEISVVIGALRHYPEGAPRRTLPPAPRRAISAR